MPQDVQVQHPGYVETMRIETDAEVTARVWADFDLRAAVVALIAGQPTAALQADVARRLQTEAAAKADATAKRTAHGLK